MVRFLAEVFSSATCKTAADRHPWPNQSRAVDSSRCACAPFDSCRLVAGTHSWTARAADQGCCCGCRTAGRSDDDRRYPAFDPRSAVSRSRDILVDSAAANPSRSPDTCAASVGPPASVERCKAAVGLSPVVVSNRTVWPVERCLQQLDGRSLYFP